LPDILLYLKQNGEQLDSDLARTFGWTLERTRTALKRLSDSGDVMICHVTRFEDEKKIEGWSCRVAGFIPPRSPGRKPASR
jgi:DNA-binding MarR family transcriptional regulator